MPARPKIYIPLLILCIISLFWFLGAAPFNTRGEPREAVVAMSMLQDGNWFFLSTTVTKSPSNRLCSNGS